MPYALGFWFIHRQDLVHDVVAQRDHTAHPHAFPFGGGYLVPDPFTGDFPFELGKGEQDIQGESAHGAGGIKLLRNRDEGRLVLVKQFNQMDKVGQGAGQSVDFIDHDHINLAGFDVIEELEQGRARSIAAGEAAIVIMFGQGYPALVSLAFDIGLTGLALGVGIEFLILTPNQRVSSIVSDDVVT